MRKYFWYELKKSLGALALLTVAMVLPYVISVSTNEMFYLSSNGYLHIYEPGLEGLYAGVVLLALAAVIITFSFKMEKRSVDCFFALPLKRWKQYLVRTLLGLCLVAIPLTIAYWVGFFVLLFRPENPYNMELYVPTYFALLFFAFCLFGFFSFVYTRANTVADGLAYLCAYILVFYFISNMFWQLSGWNLAWKHIEENMDIFGGSAFIRGISARICREEGAALRLERCIFPTVLGVLGYILQFALLPMEKAENAGQISESWFGYKVLIPVYVVCSFQMFARGFNLMTTVIIAMLAFGGAVAYKRTVRLSWKYGVVLACAMVLGIILTEIAKAVTQYY